MPDLQSYPAPQGPPAQPPALSDEPWERLLTELETRLHRWQAAFEGDGPYPDNFCWPGDLGRCPVHLADRARRVNVAQQDLHARMAMRHKSLAALLHSDSASGRTLPVPLFVDQRI